MKRRCSELEFPSFNSPPLKGGVKLKLLGNSYSVIHDENHKIIILISNLWWSFILITDETET